MHHTLDRQIFISYTKHVLKILFAKKKDPAPMSSGNSGMVNFAAETITTNNFGFPGAG